MGVSPTYWSSRQRWGQDEGWLSRRKASVGRQREWGQGGLVTDIFTVRSKGRHRLYSLGAWHCLFKIYHVTQSRQAFKLFNLAKTPNIRKRYQIRLHLFLTQYEQNKQYKNKEVNQKHKIKYTKVIKSNDRVGGTFKKLGLVKRKCRKQKILNNRKKR